MMKKWLTTILFAVAIAAFAAPATAQAQPRAVKVTKAKAHQKAKRPARKKVAQNKAKPRVKEYDFLGDELEGDIGRPDGVDVMGRVAATHASLIRLRRDFVREIGKAADDL